MESFLVDMGMQEISAHGLDHVEVIGPIVKWVYYTLRWVDDRWQRRECAVVSVPLVEIDGGLAFLRERYRGRIREYQHNAVEATRLSAMN